MPVWIWAESNAQFITFKEFVEIYVCQKCRYTNQEVQQWLKKFNLSLESRVMFVQTGHFKDAVRVTDGYLLGDSGKSLYDPETNTGKILYLFVSNKKTKGV